MTKSEMVELLIVLCEAENPTEDYEMGAVSAILSTVFAALMEGRICELVEHVGTYSQAAIARLDAEIGTSEVVN